MNLNLIRWLLAHKDVLLRVIEAAKKFDRDTDYLAQWNVIDEIARIVIPVFAKEGLTAYSLTNGWFEEDDVQAFALGAEVQALGIDWKTLVEVVLPILIAILKAFAEHE